MTDAAPTAAPWHSRPLWRGYLLFAGGVAVVALALAFEHQLPFNAAGAALAYLLVVSALLLGSLWFFAFALLKGRAWEKALAVPPVAVVVLYHLIALRGP